MLTYIIIAVVYSILHCKKLLLAILFFKREGQYKTFELVFLPRQRRKYCFTILPLFISYKIHVKISNLEGNSI